jgi:peptidoglycan/LPS O-acetylase OafA/YrhL
MFVGTVLYRFTTDEVSARTAAAVFTFGLGVILVIHYINVDARIGPEGAHITWRVESLTFLVAYLLFGGALLLRHHRFPRVVTYLGSISYSVYLLHVLVLYGVPWIPGNKPATFARWVVLTIILSICTYHGIEKQFIKIGRKVEARYAASRERVAATS